MPHSRLKYTEFSKSLLKQESCLIWIMSLSFIVLAFYCISKGFTGSLPWLSAMVGFPWTAYGVSQAMYYRKSMKENTSGGIKYESVMEEARKATQEYQGVNNNFDFNVYASGVDPYATSYSTVTFNTSVSTDEYQI